MIKTISMAKFPLQTLLETKEANFAKMALDLTSETEFESRDQKKSLSLREIENAIIKNGSYTNLNKYLNILL